MKNLIKQLTLLIAFAVLLGACSEKKQQTAQEQIDNLYNFKDYISSVTQGELSAMADIKIILQTPISNWDTNTPLDSKLLAISPNVKGKLVALNSQTISFTPETPFENDKGYNLTLNLKDIYPNIPKEYQEFHFSIHTIKQNFNIVTNTLQSYSKDWQYIEGTVHTADIMALSHAKKLVRATQDNNPLKIKFETLPEEGTLFHFTIDSIKRKVENDSITIAWSGKEFGIETADTQKMLIPGKDNFTILNVSVNSGLNQYILINFSDPIDKSQNLDGLVSVSGSKGLTFSIDGNNLKVYPKTEVKGSSVVELFQGIKSVDGYKLKNTFSEALNFEQLKPNVRLLNNATILPNSKNLKVNFEAVNLKAVDVSVTKIFENNVLQFLQFNDLNGSSYLRNVARPIAHKTIVLQSSLNPSNTSAYRAYAIDLKELITPEPGAIYRVNINFKPEYSSYRCDETNFETTENLTTSDNFDDAEETSYWDNIESYYYYEDDYYYDYDYEWRERDNPCHTSYYRNKGISTNVLASNIGLTVKKGINESYFVSTNDILTTEPLQGTKVTFYNFQQQVLGSVLTDEKGFSFFDSEKPAYFAIAERNKQKSYLKLNDGNVLSVSKFDVAGQKLEKGLKGYLYGERGVWRPGDTLFLSFVLNDAKSKLPKEHPVKFELFDPYGKLTKRVVTGNEATNFYSFTVATDENAPTGNWRASVTVGGVTFNQRIKIETIKPNRLKIKTSFDDDILNGSKPINGDLEVTWLHGAIAKNLKTDINVKFVPTTTSFKTFPGYIFDDPSRRFNSEEQTVFNGKVNDQGKTSFSLKPELKENAPGMLKASFIAKVYENGGDFSTDVFTKTYAPYETFVGINVPKGDKTRGMLLTDTPHLFEVVTVDENGKPKSVEDLEVSIHKVNWRWWWQTGADNVSSYNGSNYHEKVFGKTLTTGSDGKATFKFTLNYPDWGRYLVRVVDKNGGHATGKTMYIDWPGWAGKSRKNDPSNAQVLAFSTDKKAYNVGEKAIITFPSSEQGRALVTIENGTEVLDALWVTPKKGETRFELPITSLYAPNVFIHISLLQPHASSKNDLPIRLYGVMPISVEDPNTRLYPNIQMPDVLQPEQTITVKVNEKSGKPMTYSLAIVDEGLLDLTRFKTPNAWDAFYAKEALGVKTWDLYDDVLGAYGGKIDQVFAIGGDDGLAGAKNKKANRFKPMVIYKGPFTLGKGETKTHTLKIPKYIGSVRTMVVAEDAATEAYGNAEKTTPVRKPLMVLASLPRKITPGEKVTLPVTVFAMEKKVKNVTVKVKDNKAYKVVGSKNQTITFDQPDEQMVYFELEVSDFEGIGKVVVEASGNGEKASYEVEIDAVNPNPLTTIANDHVINANETISIPLETFGVQGTNTAQIEFSTLPPMNFSYRLEYLIQYPHGCVEQTTSAVFPQLYLSDVMDITGDKKLKIQQHIKDGINRLANFQLPNGSFSYWPGQNATSDWGTSYAGHFLIEAEKKGYVLPIAFKSKWINYQKDMARQWRNSNGGSMVQAYRLYTLALAGNPDVASMNRMRESSNISREAKYRLAATYALINQSDAAKEIIKTAGAPQVNKPYHYYYYSYGSKTRNLAMELETYVLLKDAYKSKDLAEDIAEQLNSNQWMSTQTTAYSLLAMTRFANFTGGKGMELTFKINNGKSNTVNSSSKTLMNRNLDIKNGANTIEISNKKDQLVYIKVVNSGILPVGKEKTAQNNIVGFVKYKTRNGETISPENLTQGTDFVAEVTVTNTTDRRVNDVALTEIFPSGWEIINTRFTDFGDFSNNNVTYTDIRDDRANFYFDLKEKETKVIRVLINASYLGSYYLPGIQCEAMYDNDYILRTKGKWINVVK
ncbi:alpha-2-macroglobulin family protein [Neptunitalea lumnitzerae]|uniref:Membrane protein n=1 Tax=Neptunitalea lumnitzerae TaxID=2965509 RepID=A0ABQ5MH95_9FLAO|nr:MG2 domain-containing protein [Neptunitalea sp. Y10]GLB48297.1 membrane protein [Neptunitalea sp. Y10]